MVFGIKCKILEDLRRNDSQTHGFISVKKYFPSEIIELTAYFLLIVTECADCKFGLRNMAKF